MTTNCIIEPKSSYADRIWTTGEVSSSSRGSSGRAGGVEGAAPPAMQLEHPISPAHASPAHVQVGWPGVGHIAGKPGETKDYSAIIEKAKVRR